MVPGSAVLTADDQVPVIPLTEVVGSVGAGAFWQTAGMALNAGVIIGSTVIVNEVPPAHWFSSGVKK